MDQFFVRWPQFLQARLQRIVPCVERRAHLQSILRNGGYGLLGNIIIGIVGSVIGGYLLGMAGLSLGGGLLGTIITAVIGAVVLLSIARMVKR